MRSRSSSCMSNRSSDCESVMSTGTTKSKYKKKNGKWPGMLKERAVSDECLNLTRTHQTPVKRPFRQKISEQGGGSTYRRKAFMGSSDQLNSTGQNTQRSVDKIPKSKTTKPKGPASQPTSAASKRAPRASSVASSTDSRYGSSQNLSKRAKAPAPTPRETTMSTTRKRDSSVSSSASSFQQRRNQPDKTSRTTSRGSVHQSRQASGQSTVSRRTTVSITQKDATGEKNELLEIL